MNPTILITNDDGITAPGISHLIEVARKLTDDIYVVAPDKPQSGMGHAITMNATLRLKKVQIEGVREAYSCSGTPVDCVKIATSKVIKEPVDLVLSGINHGSNSSINVIYSGTMSAAVEGAIEGIPSIGFSLCNNSIDADFTPILDEVERIIAFALDKKEQAFCLNVNFPAVEKEFIKGIRICRQAKAVWQEEFQERTDPMGNPYYWLTGKFINHEADNEATDEWALNHSYISVVPIHFDFTAYDRMEQFKSLGHEV